MLSFFSACLDRRPSLDIAIYRTSQAALGLVPKSHLAGHESSISVPAAARLDTQPGPDSFRPFAHAGEAPVSIAPRSRITCGSMPQPSSRTSMRSWLGSYLSSSSIVPRAGMTECIDERFAPDAVQLSRKRCRGRARSIHNDAKLDGFLPSGLGRASSSRMRENACSRSSEALWRGAQSANRVTALFDHLPHQLKRASEGGLRGRIRGHAIGCDMDLHRDAEKALQQRIVQLLRDARSLSQPLLEAQIESGWSSGAAVTGRDRRLASMHIVATPSWNHQVCQNKGTTLNATTASLPSQAPSGLLATTRKDIRAGRQVRIVGFTGCHRPAPIPVVSVEPIAKRTRSGTGKTQAGIAKRDSLVAAGNVNGALHADSLLPSAEMVST